MKRFMFVMATMMILVPNYVPAQHSSMLINANGVSFEMVYVEGGTLNGVAAFADSVMLSSYYIGETEVTQELWVAVMGCNPSYFAPKMEGVHCSYDMFVADVKQLNARWADKLGRRIPIPSLKTWYDAMATNKSSLQRPVENVSWGDCMVFIARLNECTGRNFRLPTSNEWEFAARGGNKSKGYKYYGGNDLDSVAWYWNNACKGLTEDAPNYGTHAVKTKRPNELGIYDMNGNVWEWIQNNNGFMSHASLCGSSWNDKSDAYGELFFVAKTLAPPIDAVNGNTPIRSNSYGLRLVLSEK